jgi:hypothetical protein
VVFDDAQDAGALEARRVHDDRRLLVLGRGDAQASLRAWSTGFAALPERSDFDVLQVDLTSVDSRRTVR